MVMKEKDEDLKRWIKEVFDEAPASLAFTNKVMHLILETPELDVRPLISRRIWRALLLVMAGLFALFILVSIDVKTSIQLLLNTPNLNALILDNWMAFGGLLMTTILIIADELWRRMRSKKDAIV